MSSATTSQYAECDEFIQYQIETARRRIKWTELLTALLLTGVLLIGYILAFTVCDHWIVPGGFSPWTRAAMLAAVVATSLAILYRFVIRPWSRQINPVFAAQMLDREDPEFSGSLLSAVDLREGGIETSEAIRSAIEKRAAVRLADVDLEQAIDRNRMMQLAIALFGLVLITCLYAVFSPKSIDLLRPLSTADSTVATRTQILKISPGHVTVDAGQQLEITADVGGTIPEQVTLTYTTGDRSYVDEQVVLETTKDTGRFRVLLIGETDRGIRQDFTYRVHAGDSVSEEYRVTVIEPPRALVTGLTLTYPDYMGLPPRQVQQGAIDVWEGTVIKLHAEANVPLKSALLRFSDEPMFQQRGEEIVLRTDDKKILGEFRMNLRVDGTFPKYYRIDVKDKEDRTDPEPTVYAVNVRPDKPPMVRLLDPIRDLSTPSNGIIPLLITAADPDFQLSSVNLNYTINDDERTRTETIYDATRQGPRKAWSDTWEFDLEPLGLKPGDEISYHVSARDNKPPRGTQSRTPALKLLIEPPVSEQQVQEQLKQDREHQEQQLKQQREQNLSDEQPAEENPGGNPQQQGPEQETSGEDGGENGSESERHNGTEGSETGAEGTQNSESGTEETGSQNRGETGNDQQSGETGDSETTPSAGTESQTDNDSAKGQERQDPVTEDEALSKIMEKYRESQNTEGNQSPQDQPDSKETGSEDQATGTERNGEDKTGSEQTDENKTGADNTGGQETSNTPAGDERTDTEDNSAQKTGTERAEQDQTGNEKPESEATGAEQTNHEQSGTEKNGDDEVGTEQTDDKDSGVEKTGGEGNGTEERGDEKSGGEKSGDEKSGNEKSGNEKSGDEKSGDEKSGGEKSGGEKSGDEKSGGQQEDPKSGDNKSPSENDAGNGQKGEGQGNKSASNPAQEKGQPGQNQSGANQKGGKSGSGDGQSDAEGMGHSGASAGGAEQNNQKVVRNDGQKGQQGTEAADTPQETNVDDAAAAADLALKRLKQDLDRGEVDQKLLDELGWTKEELQAFSERMHDRLNSLKDAPAQEADRLQQRRVEEMLKSLDLTSTPEERIGSRNRDREQRDTTARRSKAPSRLRDLQKMFRKSVSRGQQGSQER